MITESLAFLFFVCGSLHATEPASNQKLTPNSQQENALRTEDKYMDEAIRAMHGTKNDPVSNGLMPREKFAVFLEEVRYQLSYFEEACKNYNNCGNSEDLIKNTYDFATMIDSHPYTLTANLGFYDDLLRIQGMALLYVNTDKHSFKPIVDRLFPLRDKEFAHLTCLAQLYEGDFVDNAKDTLAKIDAIKKRRR